MVNIVGVNSDIGKLVASSLPIPQAVLTQYAKTLDAIKQKTGIDLDSMKTAQARDEILRGAIDGWKGAYVYWGFKADYAERYAIAHIQQKLKSYEEDPTAISNDNSLVQHDKFLRPEQDAILTGNALASRATEFRVTFTQHGDIVEIDFDRKTPDAKTAPNLVTDKRNPSDTFHELIRLTLLQHTTDDVANYGQTVNHYFNDIRDTARAIGYSEEMAAQVAAVTLADVCKKQWELSHATQKTLPFSEFKTRMEEAREKTLQRFTQIQQSLTDLCLNPTSPAPSEPEKKNGLGFWGKAAIAAGAAGVAVFVGNNKEPEGMNKDGKPQNWFQRNKWMLLKAVAGLVALDFATHLTLKTERPVIGKATQWLVNQVSGKGAGLSNS